MKLRLMFIILFLVFYLTSFIIAGHGIGTVSGLLFAAPLGAWRSLKFLAGMGLIFLLASLITRRNFYQSQLYLFTAVFFIYTSWFVSAVSAGSFWGDVVFSAHFQVLTLVWGAMSIYKYRTLESIGKIFSLTNILPVFIIFCIFDLGDSVSYATGKSIFEFLVDTETAYKLENCISIAYHLFLLLLLLAFSLQYRSGKSPHQNTPVL